MGQLQDDATLPLPLTSVERQELDQYEAVIRDGLPTFYAVGEALAAIRNRKLYRMSFPTFEDYCRGQWGIGRASAYRMIDAAEVKENLSPIGDKFPETESQVRELKKLKPDQQRQVWQKAVKTAPNGKVTAQHIKDVRQGEIPLPDPDPAPVAAPVHQVSVFVPEERPRVNYGPCARCDKQLTGPGHFKPDGAICDVCDGLEWEQQRKAKPTPNPVYESRSDWTCSTCQYHFGNTFGFFYASGRSLCRACAVHSDPCAVCKSAHSHCDGCCDACKHACPLQQDCRLNVRTDDREPEAGLSAEEGLKPFYDNINPPDRLIRPEMNAPGSYICQFCGDRYTPEHIYLAERDSMITGAICRACASHALHALAEDSLSETHFHGSDRDKMMQAGLRLFRAVDEEFKPGERVRELKEYTPTGAKDGNPLMGSWKRVETFPTTAALKRRIKDLEQDEHIVFENRL